MQHVDLKEIRKGTHVGKKVTVCGWVRTSRDSKNVAFAELNDGTELNHTQVVFDKAKFSGDLAPMLSLGAALRVVGEVVKGQREGTFEIQAENAELQIGRAHV